MIYSNSYIISVFILFLAGRFSRSHSLSLRNRVYDEKFSSEWCSSGRSDNNKKDKTLLTIESRKEPLRYVLAPP